MQGCGILHFERRPVCISGMCCQRWRLRCVAYGIPLRSDENRKNSLYSVNMFVNPFLEKLHVAIEIALPIRFLFPVLASNNRSPPCYTVCPISRQKYKV